MSTLRKIITINDSRFINRLDYISYSYFGYTNSTLTNKIIELNPEIDFFDTGFTIGDKLILPTKSELYVTI